MQLLTPKIGMIGVDVGARCIKIAQLARRGGRFILQRAHVFERSCLSNYSTNEKSARDNENDVTAALRCCERPFGRRAVATLSMSDCEYNCEEIASPAAEADLVNLAHDLATRQTRLAGAIQHDHWLSSPSDQCAAAGHTLHALSTAVATAQRLAAEHRAAGFTCEAIDGVPTALAAALKLAGHRGNGAVAAIDWGYSRATFCVVRQDAPAFVRCFQRGQFGAFLDDLGGALNLTQREARQLLTTTGATADATAPRNAAAPTRTERAVYDACRAAWSDFAEELGRTLAFLRQRRRDFYPEKIVLLGGGATMAHVADPVSKAAGIETEVWNFADVGPNVGRDAACLPLLGIAAAGSARAWMDI